MKKNLLLIIWTFLPLLTLGQTIELTGTVMDSTDPIELEPAEINWGKGHILIEDSLGNTFCIDGSKNKVDSVGLRQGAWVKYFMDYSDTLSVYRIGQKLWKGEYQNDLKQGEWRFYLPNGEIERVEYYDKGKLIRTKN